MNNNLVHEANRGHIRITTKKVLGLWKASGRVDVRHSGFSSRYVDRNGVGFNQPTSLRYAWSRYEEKAIDRCRRRLCDEVKYDEKRERKLAEKKVFTKTHTYDFENPCE